MKSEPDAQPSLRVESLVLPKQRAPGGRCEDVAGHLGNTFWVLDGAGTPARWQFEGQDLPAADLVETIDRAFCTTLLQDPQASLRKMLRQAQRAAFANIRKRHPDTPFARLLTAVPHSAVMLVRVHRDRLEFAALQDVSLLVQVRPGSAPLELRDVRQECFNATYYAALAEELPSKGAESAEYNHILDVMVDRERRLRNHKNGFFTFTGVSPSERSVWSGQVALDPGASLVLASDGGARFWTTFEGDKADMFRLGLEDLAEVVRRLEGKDPLAQRFPRIEVTDDIALLRVTLA